MGTFVMLGRTNRRQSVENMNEEAEQVDTELGFSGTRTAKVVGISYRQLDYWARTDLIRPSISGSPCGW